MVPVQVTVYVVLNDFSELLYHCYVRKKLQISYDTVVLLLVTQLHLAEENKQKLQKSSVQNFFKKNSNKNLITKNFNNNNS